MQPKVNIIILNWNGYNDTYELLESLKKISYENYKIILIDNNSSQTDVENLMENSNENIQIVLNNENLGFAGGNNVGIKLSLQQNADYILLINNDTIVEPDFLEILVEKIEKNNRAGIIAPQINFYNNPKRIWSTGGKINKIRGAGFIYSNNLRMQNKENNVKINFVSGCCMLIKKEVFQKIGLFDENFFLYIEDTDFCYRTKNFGFDICVLPDSKIYHKVNSSTKNNYQTLPLYYATRNRLYFAWKNFPEVFPLTALYIFTTMLLKSFVWLVSGKLKNIASVKRGIGDFFKRKDGENSIYLLS